MSCSVSASNSSNSVESASPWRKASSFLICSVKTKVSGIVRPPILCKLGRNRYATVGFVWQVDRPWRAGYPGYDDDQALSRSDHRPVPPAGRTGVGPEGGQARAVALARGRPRSGRQAPLGRLRPLPLRVADGTSLV